jgi:uncharacterized protein
MMAENERHSGDDPAAAFFPAQSAIDAYGGGGFRFAEMSHRGSLLCLPSGMHGWPVAEMDAVTLKSLAQVIAEVDQIEVLLLGTGSSQVFLDHDLREALTEHGVFTEAMSTGAAARTYNVLLAEQRAVAAALIAVD